MLIRDTYTEFKRVSSGTSAAYIDLGTDGVDAGYDGFIVTAATVDAVSAYGVDPDQTQYTTRKYSGDGNTTVFLAALPVGTYKLHIGAIKCANAADAVKFVVFR